MTQNAARDLTFPSGDLTLEGILHTPGDTPAAGAVVCHPHPQWGGDMHNNVVLAACKALIGRGYAALRFNVRGVGGSEGEYEQDPGHANDVRAALAHLASLPEIDAKRIGLIGYSSGAMAAAEAASGELRALALIAPPVAHADLRVAWGCPALLLAGGQDSFAPEDRLRVVAEAAGVELEIVPDADHFWAGYEAGLGEALGGFFERHFQA